MKSLYDLFSVFLSSSSFLRIILRGLFVRGAKGEKIHREERTMAPDSIQIKVGCFGDRWDLFLINISGICAQNLE